MRTILYIVRKEFLQISRDKFMRMAIIIIPILQMLVLVYAATFEMKHVKIHFADQDHSVASAELMNKFAATDFFLLVDYSTDVEAGIDNLHAGVADVVCVIPEGLGRDLQNMRSVNIQLLLNAINGSMTELALSYCNAVIHDFSSDIIVEMGNTEILTQGIEIHSRHWYNPELNYKIFMAPGILAIMVTVIGWMMAGMNLVKEKEIGTIEQLNVTPIKKYQFIAGKLIPFLLIGLLDLIFGLAIARVQFGVPVEGSFFTLLTFATVYLIAVLGIGLLISTISNTQQQVLFVSFFFVMVFVMMSGLFTSVENMPKWGQQLNIINPMAYFIRVIRMILLKGSGFADISGELISISIYAICSNTLAIWRYRKTV